jgi:hypothetical protein
MTRVVGAVGLLADKVGAVEDAIRHQAMGSAVTP